MHFFVNMQAVDKLPLIPDFFEFVGILFSGVSFCFTSGSSFAMNEFRLFGSLWLDSLENC